MYFLGVSEFPKSLKPLFLAFYQNKKSRFRNQIPNRHVYYTFVYILRLDIFCFIVYTLNKNRKQADAMLNVVGIMVSTAKERQLRY